MTLGLSKSLESGRRYCTCGIENYRRGKKGTWQNQRIGAVGGVSSGCCKSQNHDRVYFRLRRFPLVNLIDRPHNP